MKLFNLNKNPTQVQPSSNANWPKCIKGKSLNTPSDKQVTSFGLLLLYPRKPKPSLLDHQVFLKCHNLYYAIDKVSITTL